MTPYQLEETFETFGLHRLYEKLYYPLWIKGTMDDEEIEVLETFFESYDFENVDKIFVDEFLFQYQCFKIAYRNFN
ncbi:hypothetical protein [Bacillus timonensis]|uniref:hypothetical protein n=1 Tax=Bacillus timonensis TaxID=1033734 RepID=UPI0002886596|nr:hypothetical protein [Bacillus timonensis]